MPNTIKYRKSFGKLEAFLLPCALGLFGLWLWDGVIRWFSIQPIYLPTIGAISDSLVENFPLLAEYAKSSLFDMLFAFVGAAIAGFFLALLVDASAFMRKAFYPIILSFEVIPKITLAPLFIVWFGPGQTFRIAFAVYLAFFSVLIATSTGLRSATKGQILLARSLLATDMQILMKIRLPNAIPFIFSGLKIAATMAVIGVIAAEFLAGDSGLGYIVMFASYNMESALTFAALVFLSVLGIGIYGIAGLLERAVGRYFTGSM